MPPERLFDFRWALRPLTKDAVDGAHLMERLCGVYSRVGESSRALDLLEASAFCRMARTTAR